PGGVCDRRAYGRSFNTLAIAHSTTAAEDRVPEGIAAITLAHEIGHSFGAHHDNNYPLPECRGYLMSSHSSLTYSDQSFEFSPCSNKLIAATLNTNVTFRLCKDGFCKTVSMRAWEGGDACVTTGVVGVCSPRGVCSRVIHTPRSNIYPDL
ncbi:Disintegrin and metalloproteinase domain-containing protein 10, partial [Operophtera brumata]